MKKFIQLAVPALVLGLGFTITTASYGNPKVVKETGIKNCKTCHSQGKELNAAGKCFKEKKDLKACEIPEK
jgi:hypothetical protein